MRVHTSDESAGIARKIPPARIVGNTSPRMPSRVTTEDAALTSSSPARARIWAATASPASIACCTTSARPATAAAEAHGRRWRESARTVWRGASGRARARSDAWRGPGHRTGGPRPPALRGRSRSRHPRLQEDNPSHRPAGVAGGVHAVRDRTCPSDNHHACLLTGAGDERDQGVIDHHDSRLETNPPHDALNRLCVARSIDTGNPQANRVRTDVAGIECLLHDLVQHFLDLELAGGLEVGAACDSASTWPRSSARKHTVLVPPASMPSTYMNASSMVHSGTFDGVRPESLPPPFRACGHSASSRSRDCCRGTRSRFSCQRYAHTRVLDFLQCDVVCREHSTRRGVGRVQQLRCRHSADRDRRGKRFRILRRRRGIDTGRRANEASGRFCRSPSTLRLPQVSSRCLVITLSTSIRNG